MVDTARREGPVSKYVTPNLHHHRHMYVGKRAFNPRTEPARLMTTVSGEKQPLVVDPLEGGRKYRGKNKNDDFRDRERTRNRYTSCHLRKKPQFVHRSQPNGNYYPTNAMINTTMTTIPTTTTNLLQLLLLRLVLLSLLLLRLRLLLRLLPLPFRGDLRLAANHIAPGNQMRGAHLWRSRTQEIVDERL